MTSLTEEQAKTHITKLLTAMSKAGGSDLFVSKDFPPSMKLQGAMRPLTKQKLTGEVARSLAHALMNERQRDEFAKELECNFAISLPGVARFRVNVFMQQQHVGMVIRTIANEIPDFAKLGIAGKPERDRNDQARLGPGRRRDGLRKIDHSRRHDRSPQSLLAGPYRHGGGPR